jgi:hypothetical protein
MFQEQIITDIECAQILIKLNNDITDITDEEESATAILSDIMVKGKTDLYKSRKLMFQRACYTIGIPENYIIMQNIISSNEHYFAKNKITRTGKKIISIHMNGHNNSRRYIHTYLWWLSILGMNYPVSDNLLKNIWKKLENTCGCGIIDTRGRHSSKTHICIAPQHYKLKICEIFDITKILYEDAQNFINEYQPKNIYEQNFICQFQTILQLTFNFEFLTNYCKICFPKLIL